MLTWVIAIAAVLVAIAVIRREFFPTARGRFVEETAAPVFLDNWRQLEAGGLRVGDSTAAIRVIEFADVECPFCKRLHESFRALPDSLTKSTSLVFQHYPLPTHRFSRIGAQAVECAGSANALRGFLDIVYQRQDSLGLKTWESFAKEAGIADTNSFRSCVLSMRDARRIDARKATRRFSGGDWYTHGDYQWLAV